MDNGQIQKEIIRTIQAEAGSISALTNFLNMEDLAKAVTLIGNCKGRIILSGCGTSAMAARKIAHSLCCIERPSAFLIPSDAVHGALGLLQPDDILILISKGGNTRELVELVPACRAKGAYLISVTENRGSRLGSLADLCLCVKVDSEPCPFNMLATASTLAVISVFDAICIALMHFTNYTKEQFAVIHPEGAVGERLTGRKEG